jgi:DNA modification methylase
MTAAPYYASGPVRLLLGDATRVLDDLPDASADCVVTSPPYYGLRDYGTPGQLGLEPAPAAYVSALRAVFARLPRVLAPDGVAWLVLGDSYASGPSGPRRSSGLRGRPDAVTTPAGFGGKNGGGLPPKSLLGMPWRVALALQDDGWLLRSCVIWHKPNGKPESVRDRPATRHEYLFLLARQPGYWFDLDPIRRARTPLRRREAGKTPAARGGTNPGTVWSLPTRPLRQAHFAAFPVSIPLRAIAAGCPPRRCLACGAPIPGRPQRPAPVAPRPCCPHPVTRPGMVLDPFSGAATTGLAAVRLGRDYTGIDINPAYHDLARARLRQLAGDPRSRP